MREPIMIVKRNNDILDILKPLMLHIALFFLIVLGGLGLASKNAVMVIVALIPAGVAAVVFILPKNNDAVIEISKEQLSFMHKDVSFDWCSVIGAYVGPRPGCILLASAENVLVNLLFLLALFSGQSAGGFFEKPVHGIIVVVRNNPSKLFCRSRRVVGEALARVCVPTDLREALLDAGVDYIFVADYDVGNVPPAELAEMINAHAAAAYRQAPPM